METLILIACLLFNDEAACRRTPELSLRASPQAELFEQLQIALEPLADSSQPPAPKIVSSSGDIKSKPTTNCPPGPSPWATFLCLE
jgi:hypothetical protein